MATKSCSSPPVNARVPRAAELIRRLVAQTSSSPRRTDSTPDPKSADQDLLFEEEVDGVRCLLIRVAPKQKQTVILSPREQEIVRMIAKGYPNKTIAGVLEISTWTVGTHLRRIFAKLQVNSRAAMVGRAAAAGFLPTAVEPAAPSSPNARSRLSPHPTSSPVRPNMG